MAHEREVEVVRLVLLGDLEEARRQVRSFPALELVGLQMAARRIVRMVDAVFHERRLEPPP